MQDDYISVGQRLHMLLSGTQGSAAGGRTHVTKTNEQEGTAASSVTTNPHLRNGARASL